jgi:hypothetical protein
LRRPTTPIATAIALGFLALAPASACAAAPAISHTTTSQVTTTSATLEAEVDPEGKATQFHFEYGLGDCASNPCTSTPEEKLEKGEAPVPVQAQIEGLTPGTTYHFRAVAKNGKTPADVTAGPDTTFTTFANPPVFGPCPNDAFRTGQYAPLGDPSAKLPDCRAYEQASPIEKNGQDVRGTLDLARASLGGDAVTFSTTNGIPGGQGGQELPTYLSSRGSGNWSTQGILPPQSVGGEAAILGWTPSFSQFFSVANRFLEGGGSALLSRSSADQSLTTIAPYTAGLSPSFIATLADGSEVLFESKAKLPGTEAIEGNSNVYLWDRANETTYLVDVLNDGQAPPAGAFAGFGVYNQDNHALSSDGSSVYFTAAGTGQLYVRRNPTEPQSAVVVNSNGEEECTEAAKGCTVRVSASEKTNGTGPGKTDAAGTRSATFRAASADGSIAFFTSAEKLTDDATTGPEPAAPALGRAGIGGEDPNTNFLPGAAAAGVAVFGDHIYWAEPQAHAIGRAKLNPGTGEPEEEEPNFITPGPTEFETHPLSEPGVLHSAPSTPRYVAVDSGHVYWSNTGPLGGDREFAGKIIVENHPLPGAGTIGRAELDGSGDLIPGSVEEDYVEGATNPQGVAVDSEHLYWANADERDNGHGGDLTKSIGRAKLGAGGADEVNQSFIAVGGGTLEWMPQGIAVNATHIYMAINDPSGHSFLVRFDLDGDPTSKTFFGENRPPGLAGFRGIALDASHVYWSRQGGDSIGRINLDLESSSAEREFITQAGHPQGLAADGAHLYWSANGEVTPNPGNDLYRFAAEASPGARLTDIAVDPTDPNGAEVQGVLGASEDGSYVYFAANGVLTQAPNGEGQSASPGNCGKPSGHCNLYLHHEGTTSFVAPLIGGGIADNWLTTPIAGNRKSSRITPDGRTLLFSSLGEVYRYRVGEPELSCVTCGPAPGESKLANLRFPTIFPREPSLVLTRNLSESGNQVFFESTKALVGADTNAEQGCPLTGAFGTGGEYRRCLDVYEWEAAGAGSCHSEDQNGGCLYLLSTGASPDASFFVDASASGEDAFIITRSQLVRQDQDGLWDLYDVNVDGGLAAQNETPPAPCEGEACKGGAGTPPATQSPGTASFSGPGDRHPAHKKKHKKSARRKHKHRHRAKQQRHSAERGAKTTRRASR